MSGIFWSLSRIRAIAWTTCLESIRQKTLSVVFVFGLVMAGGADFFTQFAFFEQFKFLKDLGYASISMTALLVALLGASQLVPGEIERRTIYTVLSKPVHRFEFILGKYAGLMLLVTLMMAVMAAVFAVVMFYKEITLIQRYAGPVEGLPSGAQAEVIDKIRAESRDPALLWVLALVWARTALVAAFAVLFSTVATSTAFIMATTLLVYFIGHLQGIARSVWMDSEQGMVFWQVFLLGWLKLVVPDFGAYSLIDEVIAGNALDHGALGRLMLYSLGYLLVVLGAASLVFEGREL
jgi:hypothetical protein